MADCEILCIGTELLLGQILDTNSQFLAQELARLGINCYHRTTVGDNKTRIINALRTALERVEIVLISGGLGPTADDLTTECIAETLGVPLILDNDVLTALQSFFQQRGYPMPPTNRKQALRPEGANILPNSRGTAPGIIWEMQPVLLEKAGIKVTQPRVILTFPGVPSELRAMWEETARPYLESKYASGTIYSIDLKHYGIGESALAEKYATLLELANPTVAPYAGSGECKLRVTARAATHDAAKALAEPIAADIEKSSGELCYGRNDDSLEAVLARMLRERGLTIAFAESCTGGLASKRMTDIAGSSDYIKLNVVTYANEMKHKLLNVPNEILNTVGAVSAECARAMAAGVRELAEADIGVSITGIAGPGGGTDDKPVGLVYLGICTRDFIDHRELRIPARIGRSEIRHRSASEALNTVRLLLLRGQI